MNEPISKPVRRMSPRMIIAAIAGLYTVSPIDLVPDVPIIGWGDDAAVIAVGLALILAITVVHFVTANVKGAE